MSIGIKKPYADIDQSKTLLRQEKYNLKDRIHGIVRWPDEALEERNRAIEGDDTGLMGATSSFNQIPLDSEQYVERIKQKRIEHNESLLRQRIMIGADSHEKIEKIQNDKTEYCITDHVVTHHTPWQTFGEESVLFPD